MLKSNGMDSILKPEIKLNSNYTLSSIWVRFFAFLIDSLPVIIFYSLVSLILNFVIYGSIDGDPNFSNHISNSFLGYGSDYKLTYNDFIATLNYTFFSILIALLYWGFLLGHSGQTFGMKLMGTKIIKVGGNKFTYLESFVRVFVSIIPYEIVGLLSSIFPSQLTFFSSILLYLILLLLFSGWCVLDKNRQNIYDKIYNNVYIKTEEVGTLGKVFASIASCFYLIFIAIVIVALIIIIAVKFFEGSEEFRDSDVPDENSTTSININ